MPRPRVKNPAVIVLVTAPDMKVARQLARVALTTKLVACANIVPRIESHYWWQGKIERSAEILMLFKTTSKHLKDLETLILSKHPYNTPEFVVLKLSGGSRRYLDWISQSLEG